MYWDDDWSWSSRGMAPRFSLTLVMPAILDPLTVDEAKAATRITDSDRDAQVQDWIRAATRKLENDTELAVLTQTWDLTLNSFPYSLSALSLPLRPIQSVTSVKYYDSAGIQQTMNSANYIADLPSLTIGLVMGQIWPTDLRPFQPVTVRFVAGYPSADLVPDDVKQAIRLLVGHFSEQLQATQAGSRPQSIDLGYEALIAPYVRHRAA